MTDSHPTDLLGAHALGALDPADAAAVRTHLAGCDACRRQLAALAAIPALLDLMSVEPAADTPPVPAGLEDRVVRDFRPPPPAPRARSARPRRWWPAGGGVLAGAAITLVVLTATGNLGASHPARDTTQTVRLTGTSAAATAVLSPSAHGTQVNLTTTRLPATRGPQVYELWFVNATGRVSAGTFTTDGRPTTIRLSTAARPGDYQRIGITQEPDGTDPARNGPNVVAGRLPV